MRMDRNKMIILNGIQEVAEITCKKYNGDSVIDFVAVDWEHREDVSNLRVWDENTK